MLSKAEVVELLRDMIVGDDQFTVDCADTTVWASDWNAVLGEVVRRVEGME
jgi:hypothetical protein